MTGNSSDNITVRPISESEVPQVVEFLRKHFVHHLKPEGIARLFTYCWPEGGNKPNRGFAMWAGKELVGSLGAIYADRSLGGRSVKTCNLSTWFVAEDYRRAAMKLLYAVTSQKEYWITNLTPSPRVRAVMEMLGFKAIDSRKVVYLPWHFPREMFRRLDVITAPERIADVVDENDRRILSDHQSFDGLKHYLIVGDGGYSYLVLKRRLFPGEPAFRRVPIKKARLMWYPCMEMLYLSNPQLAVREWGGIVATVIRRECVLALVTAERLLNGIAPAGGHFEHWNYLLAREPLNITVDSLYSELAILPSRRFL